jgi:hypothetical protein
MKTFLLYVVLPLLLLLLLAFASGYLRPLNPSEKGAGRGHGNIGMGWRARV